MAMLISNGVALSVAKHVEVYVFNSVTNHTANIIAERVAESILLKTTDDPIIISSGRFFISNIHDSTIRQIV